MRNTKKLIIMALIVLMFSACSQQSEAYSEDVALDENYDYSPDEAAPVEETITEKDQVDLDDSELNNQQVEQELGGLESNTIAWSEEQKDFVPINKNTKEVISSKGLTNPYKDKQFIKTANLNFLVKDVYHSTVAIEEILIANNGFLINSNLYTEVVRSQYFEKSETVNVLVEEFETRNNITIRVPSENLHETLLAIADEIEFLVSRSIDADDVGLKLLAEELEQKRNAKSAQNLQQQINNGGKLYDKVYAEQLAFEKLTQKDISYLKELSIEDKVKYSTITISIFQNSELRSQEMPNFDVYRDQFKVSYGSELMDALGSSFDLIKGLFKFSLSIWPILLVGFLGFVYLKRRFLK